ncbi:response regulator [Chitinophaga sp. XS-30]|uniref:response regulator n=1 Tax=Chitinophaga sp. XS-30 TaxID=2604421 RepID=UPI0011DD9456|nr:response regulator [Chitinophaga sp. XS-30]QEH41496.1 response regulator [Chitinophaga sp. XS-30]
MKNALRIRLYIGFGLALALVILGCFFSYYTFDKQRQDARWVEHTYEAITTALQVNRLVHEMESAGLTYRSTRNFDELAPYFAIREQPLQQLRELRLHIMDNGAQMKQLNAIENDLVNLLNYWEQFGTPRYDSNYVFNNLPTVTLEERALLDKVHDGISRFVDAERELLVARNRKSDRAVTVAIAVQMINSAFIMLVAVILMVVLFRQFSHRVAVQLELKRKLKEEVVLHESTNEKNWMLSGMSVINETLRGDVALSDLASSCLKALTDYLQFPAGAVYCFDEESRLLQLQAGVALPDSVKRSCALGEGITGEAARRKEITILSEVPPDYWRIESSGGSSLPGTVICLPLWHDKRLAGVIELAAFGEVEAKHTGLLKAVSAAIATAFNAAVSREKVLSLLQMVQQQKDELEAQQEKLQESNEELTRQSEVLQASEEELRVQEEELRQINEEMNVQNNTLEQARQELALKAEELEQSSRYKSEFLANMSHELRTPLNSILILARLLEEDKERNLTEKQVQYAGIIHRSGSDLLGLINDILDLSKIEAGRIDMHIEPVPVASLVKEIEQLFAVVAQEKHIRFGTHIAPGVPDHIETDKQRLEQVIRNLLSNAFKFTPAEGAVQVRWTVEADELHIAVSDTGTGIPVEKQLLIFDAFRQADGSTSRKYGGTGLGLSISKELIARLGGRIHLESKMGEGSTFTIIMPLTAPAQAPPAEREASAPAFRELPHHVNTGEEVEDDRDTLKGQQKPVLIIEDDVNFATILRDFARQNGYKVLVAHNGNDGVFLARKYRPLAIILDMNLPLIDGSSVLKILKSNDELKNILVHVISAGEISLQVQGNIQGFTQKPLQMTDLESVFTGISKQLKALFKKVLVISDGLLSEHPSLQALSNERGMEVAYVKDVDEAVNTLAETGYDGIILDVGKDIGKGIRDLERLKELTKDRHTPVIIYLDHDISEADELLLTKNAAALVRNSTFSTDRLMDELELFLYKLKKIKTTPLPSKAAVMEEDNLAGKKVLVVDDDMRNVFSLSALFSGHGMEVVTAADGREGLSQLAANPDTHIVLMDIMMPVMDGYEAMRRIRQDSRYSTLPVIAVTAKAMTGDREKCIEAGASDYISKPVDSAKLLSLMRVWLK